MKTAAHMQKVNPALAVVLLVEDHADACTTVQLMLEQAGISNILTATDGSSALKSFADAGRKVDMILCDWNMPNMSGIQLLHQIRRIDEHLPFIMITARGDLSSIQEAKAAKVSGYILKPFTMSEMQKKIRPFIHFN